MNITPLHLAGTGRGGEDSRPHFSVSQGQMVERCPLQWRFAYVERLPRPTEYGDNWRKGVALDKAVTAWAEGDHTAAHTFAREGGVDRAYTAFTAWTHRTHVNVVPEAQTRIVTPVPMAGPSDPTAEPVECFGYLDLLYVEDGHLVDIKFGNAPKPDKLQQWQRQCSSYALGDKRITHASVLRFGDSGLLDEYVIPLDVYDFAEWAATQVRRGPGSTLHVPTPGGHCGWCDFRSTCADRCAEAFSRSPKRRAWDG